MKRNVLSAMKACVLSFVILSTTICPLEVVSERVVAEAATKKPQLNMKSKKLAVGKKCKLTIKNAGKKKWTWSTSDFCIATVTNDGEVTALNPGSVWISAECGKEALYCEIIVPNEKTKTRAKNQIKIKPVKNSPGVYAVTSTYKYPVDVHVFERIMVPELDQPLYKSSWTKATPWDTSYFVLRSDERETVLEKKYSYYECVTNGITEKEYKECKKAIKITDFVYDESAPSFTVSYKNVSKKKLGGHRYICFLFYDSEDNLVKVMDYGVGVGDLKPGETKQEEVYFLNEKEPLDVLREKLKTVSSIKFFVRD